MSDIFIKVPGSLVDSDAIHDNESGEINAIAEKASPVDADLVLIEDSEDSNNKKKVQLTNLPGFEDPLTTNGDLIARLSGATTRLGIGSNGQHLGVSAGALAWVTQPGGSTFAHVKKTADYTLTANDCNGFNFFSNDTATEKITFTLPAAVEGYKVSFVVADADGFQIETSGDDLIYIQANLSGTRDIEGMTRGSVITLYCVNGTDWYALEGGTWADVIWESLFTEDFESDWFANNSYSSTWTDDFESGWFANNSYSSIFTEDFESGW